MIFLYSLTIFVSATLLFLVQPLFARMLLPLLGGSPAVWNTVVVFFQAVLLAGYAYAHASTSWLGERKQSALHLAVLLVPLLFLPIALPSPLNPPTESSPVPWLLGIMVISVGLPFFAISTTSPLLQKWFAATGHRAAGDPYFLYAASNLGSMLALIGYPLVVEPNMTLGNQSKLWATGYIGLIVLLGSCAFVLWKSPVKASDKTESIPTSETSESLDQRAKAPTATQRIRWIMLSFVPSSLMISVTTYLSTDIASVPLLWVVPLAIYLLTFIIVFANKTLVPHHIILRAVPLIVSPLVVAMAAHATQPITLLTALHLLTLFIISLACHGELAMKRPSTRYLTEFYLWMSVGGVIGGAFNALLAPVIFKSVWEYPITLVLACALVLHGMDGPAKEAEEKVASPASNRARILDLVLPLGIGVITLCSVLFFQSQGLNSGPLALALMFGIPVFLCFPMSRRGLRFGLSIGTIFIAASFYGSGQLGKMIVSDRSFFGVHRVMLSPSGKWHQIVHGNTIHGLQNLDKPNEPQAYYHHTGPLGQIFTSIDQPGSRLNRPNRRIAVVGLGAGAIATYARPGDTWTFYEIDPVVSQIAHDPRYFTYLSECKGKVDVVLGDGRLTLSKAPNGSYDMVILDAYSSDSLPMHLLTREALALYVSKLRPGGMLAFNFSNRNLKLETTLGNLAKDANLVSLAQEDDRISQQEALDGKFSSQWMVMARRRDDLGPLLQNPRFKTTLTDPERRVWTDDYSSVLSVFKW